MNLSLLFPPLPTLSFPSPTFFLSQKNPPRSAPLPRLDKSEEGNNREFAAIIFIYRSPQKMGKLRREEIAEVKIHRYSTKNESYWGPLLSDTLNCRCETRRPFQKIISHGYRFLHVENK